MSRQREGHVTHQPLPYTICCLLHFGIHVCPGFMPVSFWLNQLIALICGHSWPFMLHV